jgi:2,4-dienoyl-CoA reductase-like NADH-dependent reductase (Old Yellow Enzyme family)
MLQRIHEEGRKSKIFIQIVHLPYEGEGEEGTNP